MFQFRLQRILDLRARREEEAATRLADARTRAEEARSAQASLERVLAEGREQLAEAHGTRRTVGELRTLALALESVGLRVAEAERAADAAEAGVERTQAELTEAFRERRVLDRLRDRHREAWRSGEAQLDRATMDGVALARFARRGSLPAGGEG